MEKVAAKVEKLAVPMVAASADQRAVQKDEL